MSGSPTPLEDNLVERAYLAARMLRRTADYNAVTNALSAQQRKIEGLVEALEHIAEEGDAEISPSRQLEGCKEIARKALDDGGKK